MNILWTSSDQRYFISDSKEALLYDDIVDYLRLLPRWSGITEEIWKEIVSHCRAVFGVYEIIPDDKPAKQVGLVRVVSDTTRFVWLSDFSILPEHRGHGLGQALLGVLHNSPYFRTKHQFAEAGSEILQEFLEKHGAFNKCTDISGIVWMYKDVPPLGGDQVAKPGSTGRQYHPSTEGIFTSEDRNALDYDVIHHFLASSYWSRGIAMETLRQQIDESDVIALYQQVTDPTSHQATVAQIGFARWVTDRHALAYLSDVFVLEEHAGKGLGRWMISQALKMPCAAAGPLPKRLILKTGTAQDLYRRYAGFQELLGQEDEALKILIRTPTTT